MTDFPRKPDGSFDWDKIKSTVSERIKSDPELAAQCARDIDDFFRPSPTLKYLQNKFKEK